MTGQRSRLARHAQSPAATDPIQLRRALARAEAGKALSLDEARGAAGGPRRPTSTRLMGTRPRPARPRPRRRRHLLAQGVHPAHDALPRPLPLLHVREAAGEARHAVPHAGGGRGDRRGGDGAWGARRRSSRWATARGALPGRARVARRARGYASTLDYVRAVAIRVIEETGLLPHLNPGVMSCEEHGAAQARERVDGPDARDVVRPARASAAARTSARRTRCRPCGCARSRTPGRLAVPFTTGILVGIGETLRERAESLLAIRDAAPAVPPRAGGHRPELPREARHRDARRARARGRGVPRGRRHGARRARPAHAPAGAAEPLRRRTAAAAARRGDRRLGRRVAADARPREPRAAVAAGSTRSRRPRPRAARTLRERLTIYPEFATKPDPWLAGKMRAPVAALVGARRPRGRGPSARSPSRGRTPTSVEAADDRAHVREGRRRRSARRRRRVYGDFDGPGGHAGVGDDRGSAPDALDADIRAALRKAERHAADHRRRGARAVPGGGRRRWRRSARVADDLRAEAVGDEVTYVVNRNINFTNVCYVGCRFCAFAQRELDAESYTLTLDEVADRVAGGVGLGRHRGLHAGRHPSRPARARSTSTCSTPCRRACPQMHVHAFSPMEVLNGATKLGISFREFLAEARAHGLGTIPGTAAEILDDDVRWVLTKGKLPADTWEEIVTHGARPGHPLQLHDHVRPRRRAAALGRAPPPARPHPGGHGRLHRVRPAAVRAPERADLPRRQGAPRRRRSRTTCACTRSRGSCSTA